MKLFLILLLFVGFQTDVPYKSSDEFQVNIDLSFKVKNSTYGPSTYNQNGERLDKVSSTPLPFLNVSVTQIKAQSDEVKIVAFDSQGKSLQKKKISPDIVLHFEMGFVDDLKKGASNHEITIYFLSEEKKKLRKIVISVAPTGVFEVNGKWHGQF
jgi:hypothetical protein